MLRWRYVFLVGSILASDLMSSWDQWVLGTSDDVVVGELRCYQYRTIHYMKYSVSENYLAPKTDFNYFLCGEGVYNVEGGIKLSVEVEALNILSAIHARSIT
jgi:hypothetical protein